MNNNATELSNVDGNQIPLIHPVVKDTEIVIANAIKSNSKKIVGLYTEKKL